MKPVRGDTSGDDFQTVHIEEGITCVRAICVHALPLVPVSSPVPPRSWWRLP